MSEVLTSAVITDNPEAIISVEPAPPVGIENLKKAIKFGIDFGQQVGEAFKDGYQWTDLFSFVDELSQTPALIKSGPQILLELKGLDKAERNELEIYVQENFDIPNDKTEGIIEDSLVIAFSIVSLVSQLKPAQKKPKV